MKRPYRCGGYSNPDGHCGATDCATCYPDSWWRDDDEPSEKDRLLTEARNHALCLRCVWYEYGVGPCHVGEAPDDGECDEFQEVQCER